MEHFKQYIDEIKDFPKEGIGFKDINPIYKAPNMERINVASRKADKHY